ncbi:hypothetical protein Hanom_Chr17g01576171 [Helianthus anomalus]
MNTTNVYIYFLTFIRITHVLVFLIKTSIKRHTEPLTQNTPKRKQHHIHTKTYK